MAEGNGLARQTDLYRLYKRRVCIVFATAPAMLFFFNCVNRGSVLLNMGDE
jgi:hypothetical protein